MGRGRARRARPAFQSEKPVEEDSVPKKTGRPLGAKTVYDNTKCPHIAEVLTREYGMTYEQMGPIFGVSPKTIETWAKTYPDFKAAVVAGRDQFDGVKVENALLKRALGYKYVERVVKTVKVKSKDKLTGHEIRIPAEEVTLITKEIPPDVKAIMFWLTNRQPERWKMVTTVNANINSKKEVTRRNVKVTADLTKMDSNQLRALRDMVAVRTSQDVLEAESEEVPMIELIQQAQQIVEAEEVEEDQ